MLDFDRMLRPAFARLGDTEVALATPYDLPDRIARGLMGEGLFRALIVDCCEHAKLEPDCAGWWIDRDRGRIFLRRSGPKTLLIAGVDRTHRVGAQILLEARLKSVKRIITVDHVGDLVEDLDVYSTLNERIEMPMVTPRVGSTSFEAAFQIAYDLTGDALRLKPRDFKEDRVMLALGGLGPGGAERQAAFTAAGVHRSRSYDTYVLCSFLDPPADFFHPVVKAAGAKTVKLEWDPPELKFPAVIEAQKVLDERFGALRFGDVYREIVRYAAVIRQLRPAVVHSWMDYCNVLCGTAAKLVGAPGIVLSGRSVAPSHFRIFQPYMKPGYRALLRDQHVIFLNNSRAGAEDYERWLGEPRGSVHVLHNGFEFPEIDRSTARVRVRQEFDIPQKAPLVGSILRFSEEKRPKLAIDTAHEIHASHPDVRFLFCGDGVLLEEMRDYVTSLGLQGVVVLPGLVDQTWDVLAAMDCFVLTSRMEGLPNVLIEAQASGLPVICTGVGGMAETFAEGETGVCVLDATAKSLADSVMSILANDDRRLTMSERARDYARQTFGIDRMVNETIDAYVRAAKEPQAQTAFRASA